MRVSVKREKVRFVSGDAECAAWHYPGTNGACVIMAGGLAVTKEPATDQFAKRFHDAGFSVLAFDYRRLGESGGQPRLVLPIKDQLADWQAAIDVRRDAARRRPHQGRDLGASPPRAVTSSTSRRATRSSRLRSPRRRTPTGRPACATRRAIRSRSRCCASPAAVSWTRSVVSSACGRGWCRSSGRRGPSRCSRRRTPSNDGVRALSPDNRYPDWQQASRRPLGAAPRLLRAGPQGVPDPVPAARPRVRPGHRLPCPSRPSRAAHRAPRGELVRMPGGHYEPFLGGHEQAVEAELSFLRRHLLDADPATAPSQHPPPLRAPRRPGDDGAGAVLRDDRVRRHRAARARSSCCCTGS